MVRLRLGLLVPLAVASLLLTALLALWYKSTGDLEILVNRSARGEAFYWQTGQEQQPLSTRSAEAAEAHIRLYPDWTSYHVLLVLRQDHPSTYARIPLGTRAAVLCSALAIVRDMNDWGYLDESGSYEGDAGKALLEVGPAALSHLRPLLDDRNAAWLSGSKEATMSGIYQYRRADFAYNYACLILGWPRMFDRDPKERDKEIEQLKVRLDRWLAERAGR